MQLVSCILKVSNQILVAIRTSIRVNECAGDAVPSGQSAAVIAKED
jgi:hypothetical protein